MSEFSGKVSSAHSESPDDAIQNLEEWLYRKARWSRLWKQVANKYRSLWKVEQQEGITDNKLRLQAEALAASLEMELLPLEQQFEDWAEQNRNAYAWARLWKAKAKQWRKKFHDMTSEAVLAYEDKQDAEALAASRLVLLRRIVDGGLVDPVAHEPGECEDCDLMREVMKELGDDQVGS